MCEVNMQLISNLYKYATGCINLVANSVAVCVNATYLTSGEGDTSSSSW